LRLTGRNIGKTAVRIAYILNTYPQPSQSFIRREIRALEAAGHDIFRFAMRRAKEPLVDPQDRAEAEKTEYVLAEGGFPLARSMLTRLPQDLPAAGDALKDAWELGGVSEVGRARHLIYLAEAAYIAERAAALGVTHMHAHFGTNAASVALLAHRLGGPPYSFTVHGPEEFDAPRALGLSRKMQRAAFTVAISHYGRAQLCRWVAPEHWDRIAVVRCGIEPDRYAETKPLAKGPRRLVAIGRLVEQKGFHILLDAMTRMDREVSLTLIGDGDMRRALEKSAAQRGLNARVTFAGWQDEAAIVTALEGAHGLVVPSFAEGLPMVIMEAMAAARPVIATYVAGIPELVRDGETGWLVPAGDSEALAKAMDSLAAAPLTRLSKMGVAGRARVLDHHDAAGEAAKLARLIAEAS
jgi:glycosyltransferase involved in cell wall biosynthesis